MLYDSESIVLARNIRKHAIKMVYEAKASHIGGALSIADILAVLYSKILNFNPLVPDWEDRDRLILSKGHACTSLYAALALKGFFDIELLDDYGKDGSLLLLHASHKIPGIEHSTGSLGHALPVGCGLALAAKRKCKDWKVFVLLSDGELDEGSNWESILFAPQHNLNNLVIIIDYNKIQSLGNVKDIIDLEPLAQKFRAFRWDVIEIDGHNHTEIEETLVKCGKTDRPTVVIANTIKGKGISFMENKLLWHYRSPSLDEYEKAMLEIEKG